MDKYRFLKSKKNISMIVETLNKVFIKKSCLLSILEQYTINVSLCWEPRVI